MVNSFDTEVAMDVGINAAILYKNIQYWCEHNRTNGHHYHDGYYWTFNSMKAYAEQFPYLSEAQVRQALKILESKGYIKSGNYSKQSYDRTKWYADIRNLSMQSKESEDSICYPSQMDLTQMANGFDTESEPIPDINTYSSTDGGDISICDTEKPKRFVPPTYEEVQAYCEERNNDVDPQRFVDFYKSKNWMVGRTKMVDWKACVRTWERKNNGRPVSSFNVGTPYGTGGNEFTRLLNQMEVNNDNNT